MLATAALESLIRGPTPEEVAAGYFSELSVMLYGLWWPGLYPADT